MLHRYNSPFAFLFASQAERTICEAFSTEREIGEIVGPVTVTMTRRYKVSKLLRHRHCVDVGYEAVVSINRRVKQVNINYVSHKQLDGFTRHSLEHMRSDILSVAGCRETPFQNVTRVLMTQHGTVSYPSMWAGIRVGIIKHGKLGNLASQDVEAESFRGFAVTVDIGIRRRRRQRYALRESPLRSGDSGVV